MDMLLPVRAGLALGVVGIGPGGGVGMLPIVEIEGSTKVNTTFIEHYHGDDNDVVHCRPSDVAGLRPYVPNFIYTKDRPRGSKQPLTSSILVESGYVGQCCGEYTWALNGIPYSGSISGDHTASFNFRLFRSGYLGHRYSVIDLQIPILVHGSSKRHWPGYIGQGSFDLEVKVGPRESSYSWGFPDSSLKLWAESIKLELFPVLYGFEYPDATNRWAPLMAPIARAVAPVFRWIDKEWARLERNKGKIFGSSYYLSSAGYVVQDYDLPRPSETPFLFAEDVTIGQRVDPMLLGKQTNFYWKNWLVQHAYLDALQSMPRLNDNSISNIIEIAGFIKALVIDHRIEIPETLADQWLAYRYTYTTTKLDAEEAIKFVHRNMELGTLDRPLTCYGQASTAVGDSEVTCRCRIVVSPRELSTLATIWRSLYTYGLQPSFYVVWDMIPYSFIVDWLVPVGDMASVLDAERMYNGNYYDITHLCYSLSYMRRIDNVMYRCYTRWKGESPVELNSLYWLDKDHEVSDKVKGFRILDFASIFLG